jgi:hypothetical protein
MLAITITGKSIKLIKDDINIRTVNVGSIDYNYSENGIGFYYPSRSVPFVSETFANGITINEENVTYENVEEKLNEVFFLSSVSPEELDAAIEAHDTSEEAHQDIRGEISDIKGDFNAYVASDVEERFSYGVEINTTVPSPLLTRIGNLAFHKSLPIQNKMKGCSLDDNGKVVEYLNPSSWLGHDRTGASGQVMVELPEHYEKFETEGTKIRARMSELPLPGYRRVPKMYISAYEASMQRSTGKLCSVVNLDPDYRGGENQAVWDDTYRSLLGRPVTYKSRTDFRNAARLRGAGTQWNCMDYTAYKTVVWMYLIEYANLDSQSAFNAQLDANGYKQGGLGYGVTTFAQWNTFNNQRCFVPCGHTDGLGNASGEVPYTVDINGDGNTTATMHVNRYRGIENPFGHIFKWSDGINIEIKIDADGGTSKVFVSTNPADYIDNGYTNYEMRGLSARTGGYIKEMIVGEYGDIIPSAIGGSSSTYWCDQYEISPASSALRAVLFGGEAYSTISAGFGRSNSHNAPSRVFVNVGSRLCFIPKQINN